MNHQGTHATGGTHADSAAAAAALRGASLAFNKSKPSASPSHKRSSSAVDNGALAAATISSHNTGGSATGLPDMDAAASRNIVAARLQQLGQQQHQNPHQNHQHQQFLQPPSPVSSYSAGRVDNSKSPSFIAATLAASRSVSPSPKARSPRRRVSVGAMSTASSGEVVDSGSIAPTGSLISMFEGGKGPGSTSGKKDVDLRVKEEVDRSASPARTARAPAKPVVQLQLLAPRIDTGSRPDERAQKRKDEALPTSGPTIGELSKKPSRPPKPTILPRTPSPNSHPVRRAQTVSVASSNKGQPPTSPNVATKKPSKPAKLSLERPSSPLEPVVSQCQAEVLSPKPTRVTKPQLPPPTPPQYQRTISRPSPQSSQYPYSPGDPQKKDTPKTQQRPQPEQQLKQQPPTPPKPRGSSKVTRAPTNSSPSVPTRPKMIETDRTKTNETMSSDEEFVSAPTSPDMESPQFPARGRSTASSSLSPTRRAYTPSLSHRQSPQNLGLDSLTNAIMAGSLASSRLTPSNTGSSLPPPPLPKRQKSPRLRQTMRSSGPASDDENGRHRRHHHPKLRSGKHAHHEGSRKKWREETRPRERKRYEAVWASNRGALLPASQPARSAASSGSQIEPPDYANSVANVVVRDIWRRSRLPEDELAEVWDLVDREKRGMLGRQEFVVGMWLIDQRLRGRKIPPKVSNSVWGSASGVYVMGPRRHKK